MGSIANEIQRLNKAKEDIRVSIEGKGVSVPSDTSISDYYTYIDNIPQEGGGGQTFKYVENVELDEYGRITKMRFIGNEVPANTYQNSHLEEVELSDNVTVIRDYAFDTCRSLKSIKISDKVTYIGYYAFQYCYGLTSVTIPDSVNTIGTNAFYYCSGMTSVTVLRETPPNLYNAQALSGTSMCPIYVPSDSVDAYKSASNWSNWKNRIVPIGWEYDYSSGTEFRYSGDTGTTEFTHINNDIITSGDVRTKTNTTLNVAYIGDNVTEIAEKAFSGCNRLTIVSFSDNSTLETIGDYAFYGCNSMKTIDIPDSVTSIGQQAFRECSGLTNIHIGSGVETIGGYAFMYCSGLTSVTIPESVTSIGDSAFRYCYGLTSVQIGTGVTTIENYAFNLCSGLTSVTIPDSVETIGNYAFQSCSGLTSVTIGTGVKTIGYDAFTRCTSLTSITILATTPPIINYIIGVFNNTNNCPIYVPDESVNAYKSDVEWADYYSRIKPLSEKPK